MVPLVPSSGEGPFHKVARGAVQGPQGAVCLFQLALLGFVLLSGPASLPPLLGVELRPCRAQEARADQVHLS
jgi:hypothetical protein